MPDEATSQLPSLSDAMRFLVQAYRQPDAPLPDPDRPPRPPLSRVRGNLRPAGGARPTETPVQATVLTASGQPVQDRHGVGEAVLDAVRRLGNRDGRQVAFTRQVSYPAERRLGLDAWDNTRKLDAVVGPAALVATGGVCNPPNVDYSVQMLSTDERPLRSDLPSFQADRGGIRFIASPTFAGVGSTATGIWTEATDANPGGLTKPYMQLTCGSEQEVYVDAVVSRLRIGNMINRFDPEYVTALTDLALANAARVAELNILAKISTGSTVVSSGQVLGAARDLLATVDLVVSGLRYRHRLADNVVIRALLPVWLRDMMRADLARSLAHGDDGNLALSDSDVESLLTSRGLAVTWLLDGQAAVTGAAVTSPFQGFGPQPGEVGLLDWPRTAVWWAFPEGSWQFLDGGNLTVNVVRDSILNGTNDLEFFTEDFESVAYRGVESLQVVSQVRPNGASAAGVATANSVIY